MKCFLHSYIHFIHTCDLSPQVVKETCGKLLAEAVSGIFAGGIRPVSEPELKRVEQMMKDLAIDADVGVEVLAQVSPRQTVSCYTLPCSKPLWLL